MMMRQIINWLKQQRYGLCVVLICALVAGYFLEARQVVFLDEQFSLAHANSSQGAFMAPDIGTYMTYEDGENFYGKWLEGKSFQDYLSSSAEEDFRYDFIGQNLKQDVHPPLYFWVVHTLCSFFKPQDGVMILLGLNWLFYIAGLVLLFRIAQFLGGTPRQAMAVCLLWGLGSGGLITVLFARMYMLQTVCFLGLGYALLKFMQKEKADFCSLVAIWAWLTAALLTQYYSVFWGGIFVGLTMATALYQKQYQKAGLLFAVGVAAGGAFLLIYPEALTVLTHSQRGEEALGKVFEGWKNPLLWGAVFARLGQVVLKNLLGINGVPALGYVLLLGVMIIGLIFIRWQKKWLLLAVGVLLAGLMTAFLMPFMYEFDVRYFAPLLPWAALVLVYAAGRATPKKQGVFTKSLFVLLLMFCVGSGIKQAREIFLRNDGAKNSLFLQKVKGKDVFVLENYHLILFYERVYYLQNARRVYVDRSGMCPAWINQLSQHGGDFLLVLNGEDKYHQGYDFTYRYPTSRAKVCEPLERWLKFLGYVRFGERFYDWYEIQNQPQSRS